MGMSIQEYKKIVLKEECYQTKSLQRQLQGKINHGLGKNFEKQIEAICQMYQLEKIAIIEKTPEPMSILRHIEKGHFETVFTKSAQPDFKGTLKGGRTIVFDAKFTESDKVTYQALSDYQRQTLLEYHELGALAFVLAGFADGAMYRIKIQDWVHMKEQFGRKYMKQEELEDRAWRVKKNQNGMIDFLKI